MRFQTMIVYLAAAGSAPLSIASPAPIDALAAREALPVPSTDNALAAAALKRDDVAAASSLDTNLQEATHNYDNNRGGRNRGGRKCYRDDATSSSLDGSLQEAGTGHNNGGGRNGGGRKCHRDAFPEVYNDLAIKNRAPAEEKAAAEPAKADDAEAISPDISDIFNAGTLSWGLCRRGRDVFDATGLCCKRGLDHAGGGCCNGWKLKRDEDIDNAKLQEAGRGGNGRCRRTLSGAGRCCIGGH